MDYQLQFRKFIGSQYLYTGIRITTGVIIPAFILYQYGLLVQMIAIPLGALFISLTDNPGPINYRRNGMLVSLILSFLVLLVAGYSRGHPMLIIFELAVFGLIFTLIGVFGNRSNAIGLTALIVFILNVDLPRASNILLQASYFFAGGLWYTLLSLILYTLRPYRPIQQLLGECVMEIAEYLETKKLFYEDERDLSSIYQQLMQYQVRIHNHQDQLREMLFTTRKFLSESTVKGRVLMMMFLESIDLMERVMTSQQDYELLHKQFDETGIIQKYKDYIDLLGQELRNIGLAIQSGYVYKMQANLDAAYEEVSSVFFDLRDAELSSENLEGFIRLRHILYSLQDITERIKRQATYTSFDKRLSKQFRNEVHVEQFVSTEQINLQLITSNISLQSGIFRHAIRLTLALILGYVVSLLFPLGHGYWILLTIAVIMKPAYSITRKRNVQRLIGTFIGVALGFSILFLTNRNGPLFIVMLIAMVVAYSFLKLDYTVSSAGVTLFVLLNFHFLNPQGIQNLLVDRIIDTLIGSGIAFIVSYFVLPAWEHEKIEEHILEALKSNRNYFKAVANAFVQAIDPTQFKIARKNAFVALANLSDNFQRMLSEPKSRQLYMQEYHQFVAATHMLTSYIASLSYYAQRQNKLATGVDFRPMVLQTDKLFESAIQLVEQNKPTGTLEKNLSMSKELQELLEKRRMELKAGQTSAEGARKKLSELKTISEQYELINSNLEEEIKILREIKEVKQPSLQTTEQN